MKIKHRFKRVRISTGDTFEVEFTKDSHPAQYNYYMSRAMFLELINSWNAGSILQSKVNECGKVDWLYVALDSE